MKKINCERLDDFGRGIGYIEGKVVFVSGMFPGEEGLVNISLNKKKYMIGELFSLEKKAVDRICPKCSYNNCGCALKSLNYEKTLIYKKDKVKTILKKFGDIDINILTNPGLVYNILYTENIAFLRTGFCYSFALFYQNTRYMAMYTCYLTTIVRTALTALGW